MMEDLLPWFRLRSVPGIGNHLFKRLIDRFGSADRVADAPVEELVQTAGINQRLAVRIKSHKVSESIRADLNLAAKRGVRIITLCDPEYPRLLRHIADPPPFLYAKGGLTPQTPCIGVVGSRMATPYGRQSARRISADLAAGGLTIVSGMALGIDSAAHEGALRAGGRTVAVMGSGFERLYPPQNRKLAGAIAASGAVVSEFSMRTEPEAYNFPVRNRIISGMCVGVVVVEATRRSGSLITARLALEQNREVFAVPGSIHSFKSTGTHSLIKQGAKLVENARDIFDEIAAMVPQIQNTRKKAPESAGPSRNGLKADESAVLQALSPYPVHIDELVRKTAMDPGKLSGLLLTLELRGLVQQSPGKRFALVDE
jgi:DNA processing protein